jgi:hypothetical protein
MPCLHVNIPHASLAVLCGRPFIDCGDDNADGSLFNLGLIQAGYR